MAKTPAKKREAEAEKLLGPCIRCGSNEVRIVRNYGFATGEVQCLSCKRRWDKETFQKLAVAKANRPPVPSGPTLLGSEEFYEEVESRVRASLVEEGKDPDTDSDHAMFLREDIQNEVRAERKAACPHMAWEQDKDGTPRKCADCAHVFTPMEREARQPKVSLQQRLRRDFPGIEREVDCLFYKNEGATTSYRLKLLWGFVKAEQIDFKQFERLVALIHCPETTG